MLLELESFGLKVAKAYSTLALLLPCKTTLLKPNSLQIDSMISEDSLPLAPLDDDDSEEGKNQVNSSPSSTSGT